MMFWDKLDGVQKFLFFGIIVVLVVGLFVVNGLKVDKVDLDSDGFVNDFNEDLGGLNKFFWGVLFGFVVLVYLVLRDDVGEVLLTDVEARELLYSNLLWKQKRSGEIPEGDIWLDVNCVLRRNLGVYSWCIGFMVSGAFGVDKFYTGKVVAGGVNRGLVFDLVEGYFDMGVVGRVVDEDEIKWEARKKLLNDKANNKDRLNGVGDEKKVN